MKIFNLFAICLILGSCSDYYFSEPQPIDSKNILTVPKKYRGVWHFNDENGNGETQSLIVGKNYFKQVSEFNFKESRGIMDLDSTTYFIGNKIYSSENGTLEGGYNYIVDGDTVIVDVIESEIVEFGEKAFLRKFDYGYILNLRHEKMNDWWEIKFIDTRSKDKILIRELRTKNFERDKNYKILHEDFKEYIIAKWSVEYMLNFIDNGGFSDTVLVLNLNKKIKQEQ